MDNSTQEYSISAYLLEKSTGPSYGTQPSHEVMNTVKLRSQISKTNFICALFHYALVIFTSSMILMLQAFFILDPNYYNINPVDAGLLISLIIFIQVIVKALFSCLYRRCSEKYGRKVTICYGALSFLLGCILLALQKDIFPGFALSAALLANGNTALTVIPLFATYIADDPRAKTAGLSTFFVGFSAVLANILLKILFYSDVSLSACCLITGGIALIGFIANSFGITEKDTYGYKDIDDQDEQPLATTSGLGEAIDCLKSNGWLIISLILQILASSDFFIFFTFFTLFIKSKFTVDDIQNQNIVINNMQTLVFIPAVAFNLFYGFCISTMTRGFLAAMLVLGGGVCSFVLICSAQSPDDGYMVVGALFAGVTIPSLNVIAGYLGVKNFTPSTKAVLVGLMGLFSALSYFVIAIVGGIVYKYWRVDGIFIICAILLFVGLISVIMVYKFKVRK